MPSVMHRTLYFISYRKFGRVFALYSQLRWQVNEQSSVISFPYKYIIVPVHQHRKDGRHCWTENPHEEPWLGCLLWLRYHAFRRDEGRKTNKGYSTSLPILFSTNILGDFEYISGLQIDTRALAGRQASVSSSPDKSGIHSLKSWPWSV